MQQNSESKKGGRDCSHSTDDGGFTKQQIRIIQGSQEDLECAIEKLTNSEIDAKTDKEKRKAATALKTIASVLEI